ncbi:predicted protein [Naegleria gruberi]|uniref:Predicted protein n=1 Tax=Naegleria gruberi TaxID=5762 RepID=D2W1V0_NAEGR|nr:uncharacterized protein NAEGRDRAFT_75278 [Naegleria gruberi]EFC36929.1 predicted protein [Naegleria gruberi]|eukprot:XP_002669673.1 predicted protein [Naegleria gruberi strain NEG-M]
MKAKKKNLVLQGQEIFSSDVCFEIISIIDDSWFILKNCSLISKQFFNVIKERSKLFIEFKTKFTETRIELFMKSQFMNSIVNVKFSKMLFDSIEKAKFITEMKQLTLLDIGGNQIGDEGIKPISKMKQLTSLYVYNNQIGVAGAKYIGEMKQLTSLTISGNYIGDTGAKFISEMKQLTSLNTCYNEIGVEGAKSISEMKQLTSLEIGGNRVGDEGAKFLIEMKRLKSLDI